ncbi:glycosyltransferase [Oleiagrimonas sp. C23AA]|uniref:glycosyltransferase n=1 Tax=Oleiagrimonas sp. C23AA TaxID=2719047 RepID=UPI001423838B|nr:glycosyltransferase [Oleiagrimonas sp. C23AA]NII10827.1 glycosyltransferase family 4 protein [Oleiagrimonas sp. C23AA]
MMTSELGPSVQLLGRDNGAGLSRDLDLLADALASLAVEVHANRLPRRNRVHAWVTRWRGKHKTPAFDINLMLERIRPEFASQARRNVLMPNPEYFSDRDGRVIETIGEVWAKTRHAVRLFNALGVPARYVGFTSPDQRLTGVERTATFFHGPGRSNNKGTAALIELWAHHPEWPRLTVVWRRQEAAQTPVPPNVTLIREHLDAATFRQLQNRHQFHLCPSQTEGFGHYLVEAMSCEAVVVTLDGEPMQELVQPDRGVLVPAHVIGQRELAARYGFEPAAMEAAIEQCLSMAPATRERLGQQARRWFETERDGFLARLREAVYAAPGAAAS